MTEYASHNLCHRNEGHRHVSKSSSSDLSTSRKLADSYSDSRKLVQSMDKIDNQDKHFISMNKEVNRRHLPTSGDKYYRSNIDEKSNAFLSEDYKIVCKSDIRPSDSSYTRKLYWDANNSAESSSSVVPSSNSHQLSEFKQDCHVASKHSYRKSADNHRRRPVDFARKVEKSLPSFLTPLSDFEKIKGIFPQPPSSIPYFRTVDHMVNGSGHSDLKQSTFRDSSHMQSHAPEVNDLVPASHKRYLDLEKKPFHTKHQSPVQSQNHKSPALNYVPHINPLNEYSTAPSQKASQESSSRPNSSFWEDDENSNDDKSLAVNLSNPTTTVASTPEKPRYPYSIEMKEGMFKTVKVGPEHETLKIHIIENFGSGDLKDGGFSWGWSIEQRSSAQPSPKTSSAPREKNSTSANKDIHKSKRRLEYDKTSSSPTPKRSKVKGSHLDGRDTKGNKEKSSKVSVEPKDISSKSNQNSSPKCSSPYTKQGYSHGEKPVVKPSKSSRDSSEAKKPLIIGKSQNSDKYYASGTSFIEKRRSPTYVPSSEMIHLPKTDCLGKNNSVIDDSTMGFISSKKERSAVYSGRKSTLEVQTLKVLCFEAVKKNILSLKVGRNVPFKLLMPALLLCSPSKLHKFEENNRHLLRHTDSLWKKFCESEFREEKCLNGEAWKDVYWRARNLRERKLKNLTASISNGMSKAHPERQAKWVGVGTNNPEKRQRKNKVEEIHKTEEIPISKPEANGKGSGSSSSHKEPPTKKRSGSESSSSNSPQSVIKLPSLSKSQVPKAAKKTLAPLMSKTKKMLNLVNRRR